MKLHMIEMGIEHLFTGVRIAPMLPEAEVEFTFEQVSASTVRVLYEYPFIATWQAKQVTIHSVEVELQDRQRYSTGEVEWIAQRVAPKMAEFDQNSRIGRLGHMLPAPVTKSMRRKFGNRADLYMRGVDGPYRDGSFSFDYAGMYCGIEADGHIHT
jgi:hypothetical protein